MSRNSSGTYSLPAGNPVLTGTTVSSTTHNNTMTDVATELTNSLDRSGRGGMTGQLKTADGTKAAPAHSFTAETGSGLYRAGANDVRLSVGATDAVQATTTAVTLALATTASSTLTSTGAFTASSTAALNGTITANGAFTAKNTAACEKGLTVTQSTADTHGITTTGNGTGGGISATGAAGVVGTGTTYQGGTFTGAAGWAGVNAKNGTAATAAARQNALTCENGDLSLNGVANPNSDVALTNVLTPANIVKAWVLLRTVGSGGVSATSTILAGMNITAAAATASTAIDVQWAADFSSANYVAICQSDSDSLRPNINWGVQGAGSSRWELSGGGSVYTNAETHYFMIMAIGQQ